MKTDSVSADNGSIIIIGAGFAGLAAGIYARMNGFKAKIFEMHKLPGGLCTSWKRKGYTFDGCIHWLVGSNPTSGMHDMWEDTGVLPGRDITNFDEYARFEAADGRTVIFYTDIDRLEKHLLEFSPGDSKVIKEFTEGVRMCIPFDTPSRHDSFLTKIRKQVKTGMIFMGNGRKIQDWMKMTGKTFSDRFTDPALREAFSEIWIPEFSIFFMLFTFAYLHTKNAGYPAGGSSPMSEAMEKRFTDLGGEIHYRSRVSKILTENSCATGIRLEDGTEHYASKIISAADGHSTIYDMLEGKFGDTKTREPYEKWQIFPPLIFVSLGVARTFKDVPKTVSGISLQFHEKVEIADRVRDKLNVHIYNHDKSMAPEGKTAITIMLESSYDYWKDLAADRTVYEAKKEEVASKVTELLEKRFPGITQQVEVTDVATPLTFERYTGNWQGTFEGWLLTPDNSHTMMKPMSQKIAGLENFYMCGQWVEPGGGLPTAVMSAHRCIKTICREQRIKFRKVL